MNQIPLLAPRVVVTLGVYRSASTWAANVVAEVLRLAGPAEIIVADSAAEVGRHIGTRTTAFVVKTHRPDASMRCLMRLSRLPVVLTVRDPADCVASLVDAFGERFENARDGVSTSCEAILWALPHCRPLTLFYEDPSARDAAMVAAIASYLDCPISDGQAADIAGRLAPDAVKLLIERMTVAGIFGGNPKAHHAHPPTQWHPGHVGPGTVGRHRGILAVDQLCDVRHATRQFAEQFAYLAQSPQAAAACFA